MNWIEDVIKMHSASQLNLMKSDDMDVVMKDIEGLANSIKQELLKRIGEKKKTYSTHGYAKGFNDCHDLVIKILSDEPPKERDNEK